MESERRFHSFPWHKLKSGLQPSDLQQHGSGIFKDLIFGMANDPAGFNILYKYIYKKIISDGD